MKKHLLALLLSLFPLLILAQNDTLEYLRPDFLQRGDTVALVAPSRKWSKTVDTMKIRQKLESWGLRVKYGVHCYDTSQPYFAGRDEERAADLQQALDDPSVKAVIAHQGGYGSVRTLPHLDLSRLRENPKWVVGFSDITMLHMALRRIGVESIHGAMPKTFTFDAGKEDVSAESLRRALFGEKDTICVAPHRLNRPGAAVGRLAGGNLAMICSAMATPEEIVADTPTVLLIEEIGESAYRIDRMMQQLKRSGLLSRLKAILVGHFTDTFRLNDFEAAHIYEVLAQYTADLGIPVVYGFPAGHEAPNRSLYMGRRVLVEAGEERAVVTFL